DALARDAGALLGALDGRELSDAVGRAAALLAAVVGQDLEHGDDGVFRIARRVAKDRIISTVDPQARHGHKTAARGFDGYKGHIAIDPDSEIITATEATPGNSGDAEVAESLLGDVLPADQDSATGQDGGQAAAPAAGHCPLASQCTTAKEGRTITIGPHEARLAAARIRQADPAWKADYRATRPKVERKIGHLMRRRHGGRRARVRGQARVAADFALLAAAVNLARLGVLGVAYHCGTWVVTTS